MLPARSPRKECASCDASARPTSTQVSTGQRAQDLLAAMAQGGPEAAVDSLPLAREMARRLRSAATSQLSARASSLASRETTRPAAPPSRRFSRAPSGLGRQLRSIDTGLLVRALRSVDTASAGLPGGPRITSHGRLSNAPGALAQSDRAGSGGLSPGAQGSPMISPGRPSSVPGSLLPGERSARGGFTGVPARRPSSGIPRAVSGGVSPRPVGPAAPPRGSGSVGDRTASGGSITSSAAASPLQSPRGTGGMQQRRSYARAHSRRASGASRLGEPSDDPRGEAARVLSVMGRARAHFGVDTIAEEAPGDAAAEHKHGGASARPRLVPAFKAAAMMSPFASSPFDVEDSQGRDAGVGMPLRGSAGSSALLDADELFRRRTWARVAGGTQRLSTHGSIAGRGHRVSFAGVSQEFGSRASARNSKRA